MRDLRWKAAWVAVMLVAALASPAAAQFGDVGAVAVGVEAGLPLVFGGNASYRLNDHWRAGVGFGGLSGLTVVKAEAQWLFRPEYRERLAPSLVAGLEQYFLSKGGLEATPVGLHAAVAVDYYLASPVSIGARLGVLRTLGSSDAEGIKVFSIRNDYTSALFNVGARYHF